MEERLFKWSRGLYYLNLSLTFSQYVLNQGVKLSMDGKGRATDNAFIERLWRSVKVEKIYLNPPKDVLIFQQIEHVQNN